MTTLVKWALPFGELDLGPQRRRSLGGFGFAPAQLPAADVMETEEELIVTLDAPGFEEKDLTLEAHDRTLVVKGEKAEEKDKHDAIFRLHERLENRFERTFALPPDVDVEHVGARFANGVLEVSVPRKANAKPRTIKIKA